MILQQQLDDLRNQYSVVAEIDLAQWTDDYERSVTWLSQSLQKIHKAAYADNERIIFIHSKDYFVKGKEPGLILKNLQVQINEIDISNFFVIVISTCPTIQDQMQAIKSMSADSIPITHYGVDGEFQTRTLAQHPYSRKEEYQYGSANPIKIGLDQLSDRERFLLTESKTFCMYPWIHLHAWPTGEAYPCCHAEWKGPKFGNFREDSLETVWNNKAMRDLRLDMINEREHPSCVRCYEQEQAGFFSGRRSANKHHGHLVSRALETNQDGSVDEFKMTYWDIRFSNLCNLKCRTCGPSFSSLWHGDQTKLVGPSWGKHNAVLNYAGKHKTDMWEQLIPHLEYVEKIYFAGGEPLIMDEHYNILDELDRRQRYDVVLIYNTNFTEIQLKDRSVFEYWKKFDNVAVGASLDAMGHRAEYIRKGTEWDTVVRNREQMLKICPEVDFYISPTLSIMNAWHVPDFHKDWVHRGFLKPQDLNINILQDSAQFRLDIAPESYKKAIEQKYQEHLTWLRPQDKLTRATVGFESAINFMNATDNTHLIPLFLDTTEKLDHIRNENIFEAIPELAVLKDYK